jgi:hypothetical protein
VRTTRREGIGPEAQAQCRQLLKNKRPGFMQWVLNSNTALRVCIVCGAVIPVLLLVFWLAFSIKQAVSHPEWWLSVALTAILVWYGFSRARGVMQMVFLYRDQNINSLVYGKKDKKVED